MSRGSELPNKTEAPFVADDPPPKGPVSSKHRGTNGMEIIFFIGLIGLWFALQIWILPKFGVST